MAIAPPIRLEALGALDAVYAELDGLIERAAAACAAGDRAQAILLSSLVVQKTRALDARLRALGLLDPDDARS